MYIAARLVFIRPGSRVRVCNDRPTAVFVSGKGDEAGEDVRAAYSSLHYEPVETVTWRARFMARPKEAVTVTLM